MQGFEKCDHLYPESFRYTEQKAKTFASVVLEVNIRGLSDNSFSGVHELQVPRKRADAGQSVKQNISL